MKPAPQSPRTSPAFALGAWGALGALAAMAAVSLLAACGGAKPVEPVVVAIPNAPDGGADAAVAVAAQVVNPFDRSAVIPINDDDPTWGTTPALVTLIEFDDFQGPYSARVQPTLAQLRKNYGPDQLRIIWKNDPLPFHDKAHAAAEAAVGVFTLAGNDAFWRFNQTAYQNQSELSLSTFPTWAGAAGVTDLSAFNAGMDAHTWSKKVDADIALTKAAGISGTPGFLINGYYVSGAQPYDAFKSRIDGETAAAKAKVAAGTPIEQVYALRTNENRLAAQVAKALDAPKEDTKTVNRVPLGKSPALGPAAAPVTIVEFGDFQCPFTKAAEATLKQIRSTYGDKVRLVWKNEPLSNHDRAEPAAEIALEALAEKGNAGFWDMHDRLFASQPTFDDAALIALATDAGLNAQKVTATLKNLPYKHTIDLDKEEGDDLVVAGTPQFFINGRHLAGQAPFDKFKTIIDEELKHAEQVSATGVSPAKLYDAMTKDGKAPAPLAMKTVAAATNAPSKGTGKIVIQEFADFQCPFCFRADATLKELMKVYPGKIKLVWRNLPLTFHLDAPLAAEAALEAFAQKGNDGFWKMHDTLFANQKVTDGLKRPALEQYAQAQGLDMTKFKNALDNLTHAVAIAADQAAEKDASITGTPSFVIKGYYVSGAQPFYKFDRVVRAALAESK